MFLGALRIASLASQGSSRKGSESRLESFDPRGRTKGHPFRTWRQLAVCEEERRFICIVWGHPVLKGREFERRMQNSSGYDGSLRLQGATAVLPVEHSHIPCTFDSGVLRAHALWQFAEEASPNKLPFCSSKVHLGGGRYRFARLSTKARCALVTANNTRNLATSWESFNRSVRWQCDPVPFGLACSSLEAFGKHDENGKLEESEDPHNDIPVVRQKRVLILMSDTGGGHRASAEAIKTTFELEYGEEYQVSITDLWTEHTPWPFNQLPKSYSFLVKHGSLWKAAFHASAPRFVHQPHFAFTSVFIARKVMRGLLKHRPDVIVSVHPLMQHVPIRILKARGLLKKIPFTTVVTDMSTCHPTWFHRLVTRCYCPTKEVAERAQKVGLRPCQIRVHGLPIRPSFCKPVGPKRELRRKLGMDVDLPAVLLMGGGEGMGPVEATARALAESLFNNRSRKVIGQIVVICGRNKNLIKKLQSTGWCLPVQIKGFETNMEEWMGACDCIITKAGPGTIAEAMIRGLPLLLNDYIAGQEVGNVPFVVNNGAGKFCKDPKQIGKIVAEWFGSKAEELLEMSHNALKLARPDAVFKIVHDLDELVRQKEGLSERALAFT